MSIYTAFISNDGDRKQVSVCWDDEDPNRFITAPFPLDGDATEEDLAHSLGRAGYRVVSHDSDNLGRGFALVGRIKTQHSFYDPISGDWHSYLTDEQKAAIRAHYPTAKVPGVH